MPQTNITLEVRLNLEGDWPRSVYLAQCLQDGRDYTEDGYLRWRAVGERLSGKPSFETQMQRSCAALAAMGYQIQHVNNVVTTTLKAQTQANEILRHEKHQRRRRR